MEKKEKPTVEVDRDQFEKMTKIIEDLSIQIEELIKANKEKDAIIKKLQRMLFGRRSEKAQAAEWMANTPALFDLDYPEEDPSSCTTEQIRYSRKKRCWNKDDLADAKRVKVLIEASEEEKKCPWCGEEMEKIGEEKIRTRIVVIEPEIRIEEIYTETYVCSSCMRDGEGVLFKTKAPSPVIPHSYAGAEAIAHVANERFVKGVPYHRQEKEWRWLGVTISRRTMSNWVMKASELYLEAVVEKMKEHLMKEDCCHCDETGIQVLKEEGRKNTSVSYMWVYSSTALSSKPIRIFSYAPGRGGQYPKEYLKDYKGFLITDGYRGYDQVEDVERVMCWAHARRKFYDALPKNEEGEGTICQEALEQMQKIFHIESKLQKLEPKERQKQRDRLERKPAERLFAWAKEILEKGEVSSASVKNALQYLIRRRKELLEYMEDGRLPMTNSLAERTIRSFAIGRNNWIFSGSPRGARACGVFYSIVESAKANGLVPYKYILYLLKELPKQMGKLDSRILEQYMPWNPIIKSECI